MFRNASELCRSASEPFRTASEPSQSPSGTPPDPSEKVAVDAEDIVLGIPQKEESEEAFDPIRKGKVAFFDHSKGFGFIMDTETQEKHFVHVSGLIDEIDENDKVTFELEKGQKGMNAVRVKQQS